MASFSRLPHILHRLHYHLVDAQVAAHLVAGKRLFELGIQCRRTYKTTDPYFILFAHSESLKFHRFLKVDVLIL